MRIYGFCTAPLYYNSDYSGYNLQPNQNVQRFGNLYITNEYSMRSNPLKNNEFRIVLVGDSVLNGGVQTDQSELASTKLENVFQELYGSNVRVLNISCGGWGIDNSVGVFEEFGDFNAKMIVLVFNSHDAIGTISNSSIAGNSKSFPCKQYSLAWFELFDRYLIPKISSVLNISSDTINSTNTSTGEEHSEGWEYFYQLCQNNGIKLAIYLHATQKEIMAGQYDDGGQWIIDFATEKGIQIIGDINTAELDDYRDNIHFSSYGQNVIYDILYSEIRDFLESNYIR